MGWLKRKTIAPNPLESGRAHLDDELRQVQARIKEKLRKQNTPSTGKENSSAFLCQEVVRADAPTHLDAPSDPLLKKVPTSSPQNDPANGKINPWALWSKFLTIIHLKDAFAGYNGTPMGAIGLGNERPRKTRREMMYIRRRFYLLLVVFALILWGISLMYFKH